MIATLTLFLALQAHVEKNPETNTNIDLEIGPEPDDGWFYLGGDIIPVSDCPFLFSPFVHRPHGGMAKVEKFVHWPCGSPSKCYEQAHTKSRRSLVVMCGTSATADNRPLASVATAVGAAPLPPDFEVMVEFSLGHAKAPAM